jgi:hypothetical protein
MKLYILRPADKLLAKVDILFGSNRTPKVAKVAKVGIFHYFDVTRVPAKQVKMTWSPRGGGVE